MPTLEVDFLGFRMKNPFILASAPPTNTIDMIKRAFDKGWGGAVTKTIPVEKIPVKNVNPRITSVSFPGFEDEAKKVYAFGNIELVTEKKASYWMDGVAELKRQYPDNFVMTSIMADGDAEEDWVELARRSEDAGADAVELNFSCPHGGMPPHAVGAAIGQDPKIASRIVSWVRQAVKMPIVVKLTGAVSDPAQIATVCKEAGADAFCTINSFPVILGIDLETHSPLPQVDGQGNFCGYTGKALKPIALRVTAQVAPVGLPISGCGGISTWEDAAQFVLVGATSLQACSAVMLEGYDIIDELTDGLEGYLEDQGAGTLDDIRGKALSNITPYEKLNTEVRMRSSIDLEVCTKCGRCHVACRDAGYQAISEAEDRTPSVDPEKCDGCGLCVQVCPVWDCITMIEKSA